MKIHFRIYAAVQKFQQSFPKRIRAISIFTVALFLVFLTNAFSLVGSASPKQLRVGISQWVGFEVIRYAEPAGIFKQRGLDVKLIPFENSQDASRAVMNGRLDATFTNLWDVMQVDSGLAKPHVLMVTNISDGSDGIVAQSSISSVTDLKGKRVAAKLGTVNHLILLEALKAHQLQPNDVTILNYSNEVAAEKMQANEIDAAVLWELLLTKTAQNINGAVIHTTKQLDSLVVDILIQKC